MSSFLSFHSFLSVPCSLQLYVKVLARPLALQMKRIQVYTKVLKSDIHKHGRRKSYKKDREVGTSEVTRVECSRVKGYVDLLRLYWA